MPRISAARASASSGVSASLIPPALPRPPVSTCALTTTGPPSSAAAARASLGARRERPRTPGCRSAGTALSPGTRRGPKRGRVYPPSGGAATPTCASMPGEPDDHPRTRRARRRARRLRVLLRRRSATATRSPDGDEERGREPAEGDARLARRRSARGGEQLVFSVESLEVLTGRLARRRRAREPTRTTSYEVAPRRDANRPFGLMLLLHRRLDDALRGAEQGRNAAADPAGEPATSRTSRDSRARRLLDGNDLGARARSSRAAGCASCSGRSSPSSTRRDVSRMLGPRRERPPSRRTAYSSRALNAVCRPRAHRTRGTPVDRARSAIAGSLTRPRRRR